MSLQMPRLLMRLLALAIMFDALIFRTCTNARAAPRGNMGVISEDTLAMRPGGRG